LKTDLEGKEQSVEELVFLVQPSNLVFPHFISQVVYDVRNPLTRDGGFVRPEVVKELPLAQK